MAVTWLRRLAMRAPVPVFVVAGRGARSSVAALRLDPRIEVVGSPRHASVLLAVGEVPADHAAALRQIHDQLPHPRAVVWWSADPLGPVAIETLPSAEHVPGDPVPLLVDVYRSLVAGERDSSAALGPQENPTDWKGVGPHGQGGEGMMGGTPYGRSMPMTGEDVRDGLQLDRVPLTLGPYHDALPPGLTLDLELQGDVVVSCATRRPGPDGIGSPVGGGHLGIDDRMLWLTDLLRVHGLSSRADRLLRRALEDGTDVGSAAAAVRRALYGSLAGVGEIDDQDALDRLDRIVDGQEPRSHEDVDRLLAEHLPGAEWSAAITTVWTLDPAPLETRRMVAA